jgi:hypothetical protein
MNSKQEPVHLAVRVPLMTTVDGRRHNTVELHNEIAQKLGKVVFAKIGQPGTVDRARRLNDQIKFGKETLLLLVIKRGARFLGFQAPMLSVHFGRPTNEIYRIAPPYYANIHENPSLWFAAGKFAMRFWLSSCTNAWVCLASWNQ